MIQTAPSALTSPVTAQLEQRSGWPLLVGTAVLWLAIAILLAASLQRTGGRLVYALDDPYIHMAMAKNVALHGVWGVTADAFTSSSSSPAWTAGLAFLFWIFGVKDAIPFVVNVVLATVTLAVVFRLLRRRFPGVSAPKVCLGLVLFTVATPLPTLVFAGQEHILHLLCALLFVSHAADLVAGPRIPMRSHRFLVLAGLAAGSSLTRYEALYMILIAAALLVLRRRLREAIVLTACGAAPIAVYAAVSMAKGWWWAPNSVLLKGNLPDWTTMEGLVNLLGYSGYSTLLVLPSVAFLVYAGLVLFLMRAGRNFWEPVPVMLVMFVAMALLHVQHSQPRAFWLYRYEAYVIATGVIVLTVALFERISSAGAASPTVRLTRAGAFALLLLVSPLTERAVKSAVHVPRAVANIHEQQYQMGAFLRRYYPEAPVALNDIGAPAYLAGVKVLDLIGLTTMDVAKLRRAHAYTNLTLDDLAHEHRSRIAIVYDRGFPGGLPRRWIRAGKWTIRHPLVVGEDTVTFYAIGPEEYGTLVASLKDFERELPQGVTSVIGP